MRNATGRGSSAHSARVWHYCRRLTPLLVVLLASADYGWAQPQPPAPQEPVSLGAARGFGTLANVLSDAPIYLLPDRSRLPLRVAKLGSQVRVLQQTGEWANIQFQDPELGLRTGYVERRFIQLAPAGARPQASQGQPPETSDTAAAAADAASASQLPAPERRAAGTGFFVGGGFEWSVLTSNDLTHAPDNESGPGVGILAGYGLSRVWSLYGGVSFASVDSSTFEGTYSLTQIDVGTRVHFAPPGSRAAPFAQFAFSRRSLSADYTVTQLSHTIDASGAGVSFGGGVNVYVRPALALSAGASWMAGDFGSYELDGKPVSGGSPAATSARVHVGMVWFPN